jgi:hypothetical protein
MEGRDLKQLEGTGLNVRRYRVRWYVINGQFRSELKVCFVLYRVLVLHSCCYLCFIVFLWRACSLGADSISCTSVCYLKVSCRRLACNCCSATIISCTLYRYVMISVPNSSI